MLPLINNRTAIANWLALVSEAEGNSGQLLTQDLESYLVFLLQRFVSRTELAQSVLALDFVNALNHTGNVRGDELRDVGDKCLLYSGLFPEQAQRKRIAADYFIKLGQTAYDNLAALLIHHESLAELYTALCNNFVDVTHILQCIRQLSVADQNKDLDVLKKIQLAAMKRESGLIQSGRSFLNTRIVIKH